MLTFLNTSLSRPPNEKQTKAVAVNLFSGVAARCAVYHKMYLERWKVWTQWNKAFLKSNIFLTSRKEQADRPQHRVRCFLRQRFQPEPTACCRWHYCFSLRSRVAQQVTVPDVSQTRALCTSASRSKAAPALRQTSTVDHYRKGQRLRRVLI